MVEKNIIVDGDGTIYLDSTRGNWQKSEKAIIPFARCVLKQPEESPLIEYRIDYDKVRSLIDTRQSLEDIIISLEQMSTEPVPLSVISDLKMLSQGELVLEKKDNELTLSGNYASIDRIAKKGIKGVRFKRSGLRKLSIDAKDIPELKKALEGKKITGLDLAKIATEEELLYQHGVPLNYLRNNPEVQIKRSGRVNIVSSPNLEQAITEAREKVKQDLEKIKQKIPHYILEIITDRLDSNSKKSEHKKSRIDQAFIVLELLLETNIAKEFAEKGLEYIQHLHEKTELNYKNIIEMLALQGWSFAYTSSEMAGQDMRVNIALYPERTFYIGKDKYRHAHAFLKQGPNMPNIADLRSEISEAVLKHQEIFDKKTRNAAKAYFCDKFSFWQIQRDLELTEINEIPNILFSAVQKLSQEGLLSDNARIKSVQKKVQEAPAPKIITVKEIPEFIHEDTKNYQRLDLFEREWKVKARFLKEQINNLEIISRQGNNYILLCKEVNDYLWKSTEDTANLVRSCRELPKKAYRLLKQHFFHCNSLTYLSSRHEQPYSETLQEMEESLDMLDILSKQLSFQFTRRRLFEAGMKFIPLYEIYNELGIPSAIITNQFPEMINSIDSERGIIVCKTYRNILENTRQQITENLAKFSQLLPNEEACVLQALFAEPRQLTEIEACQNITKYKIDLDHIIIRSYNLLMQIPEQTFTPETKYATISSLSREYNIPKNMLTSIPGISLINANGIIYARTDQTLRNKLKALKPKEIQIGVTTQEA